MPPRLIKNKPWPLHSRAASIPRGQGATSRFQTQSPKFAVSLYTPHSCRRSSSSYRYEIEDLTFAWELLLASFKEFNVHAERLFLRPSFSTRLFRILDHWKEPLDPAVSAFFKQTAQRQGQQFQRHLNPRSKFQLPAPVISLLEETILNSGPFYWLKKPTDAPKIRLNQIFDKEIPKKISQLVKLQKAKKPPTKKDREKRDQEIHDLAALLEEYHDQIQIWIAAIERYVFDE